MFSLFGSRLGEWGKREEDREERRFETYNILGRTASPLEADCDHSRKQRPSVRGPKFNFGPVSLLSL